MRGGYCSFPAVLITDNLGSVGQDGAWVDGGSFLLSTFFPNRHSAPEKDSDVSLPLCALGTNPSSAEDSESRVGRGTPMGL